jgi:hypothetical protein
VLRYPGTSSTSAAPGIVSREAKRVYGKLDVPNQVDIVEAPEKARFTPPPAATAWFAG